MRHLAKVGFSQSYTYFTWRNTKAELDRVLHRADADRRCASTCGRTSSPTRPTSCTSTCSTAGAPAFQARLVLAATLGASYGIYSGFELCENVPVARGQRGVPRLGEVPDPAAGLRDGRTASPRLIARVNAHPARAPGAAVRPRPASSTRPTTPQLHLLQQAHARRHRSDPGRRQPRSRQHAARLRRAAARRLELAAGDDARRRTICCRTSATRGAASGTTSASIRRTRVAHIVARAVADPPETRQSADRPNLHAQIADDADPLWYKDADHLRAARQGVLRQQRRRHRRLPGPDREARLPPGAWGSLPLAAAVLPVAAARRRLRHRRLPRASIPATARSSDFQRVRPTRRTSAASGSSPSWSSTTRPTSTRGSRRRGTRPPGSPERDFYVWSDTDQKYHGVRIIFTDTETSNWTWDPVAKAYYWHRFFHHQPDLNYDNPRGARRGRQGDAVLARHGGRRAAARRDPVPDRARGDELREPRREPRGPQADPRASSTRATATGCSWPRPTSGRPTCCRTSATATNATWRSTSR